MRGLLNPLRNRSSPKTWAWLAVSACPMKSHTLSQTNRRWQVAVTALHPSKHRTPFARHPVRGTRASCDAAPSLPVDGLAVDLHRIKMSPGTRIWVGLEVSADVTFLPSVQTISLILCTSVAASHPFTPAKSVLP
jgi:hypothetical protein